VLERAVLPFDMRKPVLIVIDMLNDFLASWARDDRERLISEINALVEIMRKEQLPVIWVRQEFEPDLSDAFPEMRVKNIHTVIKGTEGCQIDSRLNIAPTDIVIVKKRYSAFHGTNLDEVIARLQPDCIVIAGINTHACVRTTLIDAYQRDWPIVVATDCVGSYDHVHHQVTLDYVKDKLATLRTNSEIQEEIAFARS
jgi:nicotinamidase-related amidase